MADKEENNLLELYSQEELDLLEGFIDIHFGKYETVFHELASPDIHVDIAVIPPTAQRDFYTLVTIGMGAHRMNMPEELSGEHLDRAEIVVCLPSSWHVQENDEEWYWPLRWLKILARLPGEENSWLGWGHTVPNSGPFAENTQLSSVILLDPGLFFQDGEEPACPLPGGERVHFYQMVPLYQEELEYKINHNAEDLIDRMAEAGVIRDAVIVSPNRVNACASVFSVQESRKKKEYAIPGSKLKELLTNWDGPEGCFATDRILIDGCKVGYLYREEPDEDYPDSGWRFLAGDETDEYLNDPDNMNIYALNTICNYDPDIIPLLRSPYGTAFYRDENGIFQQEEPDLDAEPS